MRSSTLKRWAALSSVLGIGLIIGLVLAGSWNITPAGTASEIGRLLQGGLEATGQSAASGNRAAAMAALDRPAVDSPDPTAADMPSTRSAAAKVRPAVVAVEVNRWREGRNLDFHFDIPGLPEQFRDMFPQQPQEDEPMRQRVRGQGSGFIFTKDGYIITNNHVVEDAADVDVVLPDKRRFKADVVGADAVTDVAVLKIQADQDLPTVQLGDSESVQIGDWVLAVGNPLEFNYTVTVGIVSAKGRSLQAIDPSNQMIQDFIQTDAVINRGNSGGPLVDLNGSVVGINSAIASRSGFSEGYGFAIPINLARSVARDLIEHGAVRRGYLGIYFNEITAEYAKAVSLPDNPPVGAVVQDVIPGGAAQEAGVRAEDVILEINGTAIENSGQLQSMVSTLKPGTTIDVLLYRGGTSTKVGQRRRVKVTLKERPEQDEPIAETEPARQGTPLGMGVGALSGSDARRIGFEGRGVVITDVEQYGPAFDGGLAPNMVIVAVDGQVTPDVETFNKVVSGLRSGSAVLVRVFRPGAPRGNEYASVPVEVR